MHNGEALLIPQRLQPRKRRMQTEETIEVDHSLGRILKPDWKTAAIPPLKFRETPMSPPEAAPSETN